MKQGLAVLAEGLGFGVFTNPKSLSRVLEFLIYLWCRGFRCVFLIPNRPKHLPADVLVLTPLSRFC